MSARISLAELEAKVRWQADQERAEARHTSAKLREEIRTSVNRYRELFSDNGSAYYLTNHCGKIQAGPAPDRNGSDKTMPWGEINISSINPEIVRIYGIDVDFGGTKISLEQIAFAERNHYDGCQGEPIAFFGFGEDRIGVVPLPAAEYPFTLWYLPTLSNFENDDDVFNPGVPGGEQWVVWDVMHKIFMRDNYPGLLQFIMIERDKVGADIIHRISSFFRVKAEIRRDTKGERKSKLQRRSSLFLWRR